MTALRLRYVQAWVDAEGRPHVYFRKRGHKRVALPGLPGSDEFMAAYRGALNSKADPIGAARTKAGSVSASIAAFYLSKEWNEKPDGTLYSEGTKGARRSILERFRGKYGDLPFGKMHADFLEAYLGALKPHARRNTWKAIRAWLRQAKHDITKGMTAPQARSNKHASWKPEQIAAYEATHAVGTKARLCFALARYTGAARAEIARMGPAYIRNGEIEIGRQKTGVMATIPMHPELQKVIDATPVTGFATFLVTKSGKKFSPSDLSEAFRGWCDDAKLPQGLHLHGLRHTMGDTLADHEANPFEIAGLLGHKTVRSALHYTQESDRRKAGRRAMRKLIAGTGNEP